MTLQQFILVARLAGQSEQPMVRPVHISESRWQAMWTQYNQLVLEARSGN